MTIVRKIKLHCQVGTWYFMDERSGCMIVDPYASSCGRFEVDPMVCYGITHEQASQLALLNRIAPPVEDVSLEKGHAPTEVGFWDYK